MARGSTATKTPSAPPPAPPPPPARAKTVKAPKGAKVAAIDPTARDAKDEIAARFPTVVHAKTIDAPAGVAEHAKRYLAINAEITRLNAEKERCANHIKLAIADNEAIEDETFRATWAEAKGPVDWKAVQVKYLIPDPVLELFRKPGSRTLTVTGRTLTVTDPT